jgi:hypothetical protein
MTSSLHVYEDEIPLAEGTLEHGVVPVRLSPVADGAQGVGEALRFEERLRRAVTGGDESAVERLVNSMGNPEDLLGELKCSLLIHAAELVGRDDLASMSRRKLSAVMQSGLEPRRFDP